MGFLEARARIVGAVALALAAGTFAVVSVAGTDAFVGVPNVVALLAVVALPGFLLGRTGVPARVGPLAYEAALSFAAGGVVATGVLATGTFLLAVDGGVVAAAVAFLSTLATSWAPWGVAGYAVGLASTVVEATLGA